MNMSRAISKIIVINVILYSIYLKVTNYFKIGVLFSREYAQYAL